MKFEVFTVLRNKFMDSLFLEFRMHLLNNRVLKKKLSAVNEEEIKNIDIKNTVNSKNEIDYSYLSKHLDNFLKEKDV